MCHFTSVITAGTDFSSYQQLNHIDTLYSPIVAGWLITDDHYGSMSLHRVPVIPPKYLTGLPMDSTLLHHSTNADLIPLNPSSSAGHAVLQQGTLIQDANIDHWLSCHTSAHLCPPLPPALQPMPLANSLIALLGMAPISAKEHCDQALKHNVHTRWLLTARSIQYNDNGESLFVPGTLNPDFLEILPYSPAQAARQLHDQMRIYCDHKRLTASHNALFNNMKFPLAIHTASLTAIILRAFFETHPFHNPSMGSNLSI